MPPQSDDLWQAKCAEDWGEIRKVCPHQRSPLVLVPTYLQAWRAWRRAFHGYRGEYRRTAVLSMALRFDEAGERCSAIYERNLAEVQYAAVLCWRPELTAAHMPVITLNRSLCSASASAPAATSTPYFHATFFGSHEGVCAFSAHYSFPLHERESLTPCSLSPVYVVHVTPFFDMEAWHERRNGTRYCFCSTPCVFNSCGREASGHVVGGSGGLDVGAPARGREDSQHR